MDKIWDRKVFKVSSSLTVLLLLVRLHDQSSKLVVFFRSSKPPYNFWWSGVADGHCAIRSGLCLLHLWRTCSVVWSSSPQGHVGEGTHFSFLWMCALSLLWPERNRVKNTWPGLSRRWYVCILLLSGFHRCLDDGGLFLVMDASWWLLFLCSAFG